MQGSDASMPAGDTIRVVAFIEASTVTGPAKNLLRFATSAREPLSGLPRVAMSIATFCRGRATNSFIEAARAADIEVDIIRERSRFDFGALRQMREIVRARRP